MKKRKNKSELSERSGGGRGTHLCAAAKALIIERILHGDTNRIINQRLRAAGYLQPDQSVSAKTLTAYRSSPEAKERMELLTEEGRRRAWGALNDAVEYMADLMHLGHFELINEYGEIPPGLTPAQIRLYGSFIDRGANFFWNYFGPKDPLGIERYGWGTDNNPIFQRAYGQCPSSSEQEKSSSDEQQPQSSRFGSLSEEERQQIVARAAEEGRRQLARYKEELESYRDISPELADFLDGLNDCGDGSGSAAVAAPIAAEAKASNET